jgi:hypothetical protein
MEEGNNLFDVNKIILQISSVKRNKTLNVNYCVKQIQNMNLRSTISHYKGNNADNQTGNRTTLIPIYFNSYHNFHFLAY